MKMKKYLIRQNITALARIAVLGALVFLSVSVLPAFAATLSRSADVSATLSAMWSMIGPLFAIRDWLPPLGSCARGPADQITFSS